MPWRPGGLAPSTGPSFGCPLVDSTAPEVRAVSADAPELRAAPGALAASLAPFAAPELRAAPRLPLRRCRAPRPEVRLPRCWRSTAPEICAAAAPAAPKLRLPRRGAAAAPWRPPRQRFAPRPGALPRLGGVHRPELRLPRPPRPWCAPPARGSRRSCRRPGGAAALLALHRLRGSAAAAALVAPPRPRFAPCWPSTAPLVRARGSRRVRCRARGSAAAPWCRCWRSTAPRCAPQARASAAVPWCRCGFLACSTGPGFAPLAPSDAPEVRAAGGAFRRARASRRVLRPGTLHRAAAARVPPARGSRPGAASPRPRLGCRPSTAPGIRAAPWLPLRRCWRAPPARASAAAALVAPSTAPELWLPCPGGLHRAADALDWPELRLLLPVALPRPRIAPRRFCRCAADALHRPEIRLLPRPGASTAPRRLHRLEYPAAHWWPPRGPLAGCTGTAQDSAPRPSFGCCPPELRLLPW